MKQEPKTWYDRMESFLTSLGFTKSKEDSNLTGASLVDQYLITLVHIVGFKIIKKWTNILYVLGDEGFKVGEGRVVNKDWGIKRGVEEVLRIGRGFQQKDSGSISLEIKDIL